MILQSRAQRPKPTAMSLDDVLVDEMPAKPRAKFESEGRNMGWLIGLLALLLVTAADYYGQPLLANTFGMDIITARLIAHLLVFFAFLNLLILPGLMEQRALRRQVAFRRQHGKWRWDR